MLMLTSHFINVGDPIVTGLILKAPETACFLPFLFALLLLNGTFVVCMEQLEHAVHIIAIYLG